MVGRRNSGSVGIRQHPATGILLAPEFGDIRQPSPNAVEPDSDRNWLESGHGQKPAASDWILPDPAKMAVIRLDLIGLGGNGRIPAKIAELRLDLEGSDWIWPKWPRSGRNPANTCSPESDNGDRTLPDSSDSCIFASRNFFLQVKRREIFLKKLFHVETHRA
jgi:hypothetical protein